MLYPCKYSSHAISANELLLSIRPEITHACHVYPHSTIHPHHHQPVTDKRKTNVTYLKCIKRIKCLQPWMNIHPGESFPSLSSTDPILALNFLSLRITQYNSNYKGYIRCET